MTHALIREVQESGLLGVEMAVMLTLAIEADSKRFAVMSHPDLCRRCGWERTAVAEALVRLEAKHYITTYPAIGRRPRGFKLNAAFGP